MSNPTPTQQGETRLIPLTNGMSAVIDAEDYDRIASIKWRAVRFRKTGTWYAVAGNANRLLMHRVVLGLSKGDPQVDHKDSDGLNNTKQNLRTVTNAQNQWNAKLRKGSKTGFKGVILRADQKTNPYRAVIKVNYKQQIIGNFPTAEQAARAYDSAARERFGEHAWLNFPEVANDRRERN